MKFFVWSDDEFYLRAKGKTEKYGVAEIESFEPFLLEAFPVSRKKLPVCMELSPSRDGLIMIRGDAGLELNFPPRLPVGFYPILQKRCDDALVTVCRDGGVRITAENACSVEISVFPTLSDDFEIKSFGKLIFVYNASAPHCLAVFRAGEKIEKVFENVVWDFEISPLFRTKTRLFDFENTTVTIEWKDGGGRLEPRIANVERETPYTTGMGEKALLRSVLDRVKNGLEASDLLAPQMRENALKLSGYFGNFTSVLPDFLDEKGVCLAYTGESGRYSRTFYVECEGGLAANFTSR